MLSQSETSQPYPLLAHESKYRLMCDLYVFSHCPSTVQIKQMYIIRKGTDFIYGIWLYHVRSIKNISKLNHLRGNITGTPGLYIKYEWRQDTNRKFLYILPKLRQMLFRIIDLRVDHHTPNTTKESVAQPGTLPLIIISLIYKFDLKEVHGNFLKKIFSKRKSMDRNIIGSHIYVEAVCYTLAVSY